MKNFSNWLFKARLQAGLTQSELAVAAGLQVTTISNLENNRGFPRKKTRLALEAALGEQSCTTV